MDEALCLGEGAVGEVARDLEAVISAALGLTYRLTPLPVKCTYPVFRGDAEGAAPIFVKLSSVDDWQRALAVRKALEGCDLIAPFLTDRLLKYGDLAVSVHAWVEGETVFPEDMSEKQMMGFVAGCVRLSEALRQAGETVRARDESRLPETLYRVVAEYGKRHPVAARLLWSLIALPEAHRSPSPERAQLIHGDFHAKNFAFRGDELAQVFDLDQPTVGLPCSDLTDALVERFSVLSLSSAQRRRVRACACEIFSRVPWSREDLETAINILRLRFAARRILKHPNSAWVAVDIARRDCKIREIFNCLKEGEG